MVFGYDLAVRAAAADLDASTETDDEADALGFLRINPLVDGHNDLPTRLQHSGGR